MSFKWFRTGGGIPNQVIPAFTSTADKTVVNSVAETSIIGTGNGSRTIPANTAVVGNLFLFSAQGRFSAVANPTLKLKLLLGSVILGDTGDIVLGNASDDHWFISGEAVTRSVGATGTVMVSGSFITSAGDHFKFVNSVPVVIDTTVDNIVDITAQWGTANAGNTLICQIATLIKILSP